MLMNNLDPEVAERPDDLVVYGGTGRAARNWATFDAIVSALTTLADDETLLVQSGKPVGVLRTTSGRRAYCSRIRTSSETGRTGRSSGDSSARAHHVRQMTAGSWIYIGSQGILQAPTRRSGGGRPETRRVGLPPGQRRHPRRYPHPHCGGSAEWAARSHWR